MWPALHTMVASSSHAATLSGLALQQQQQGQQQQQQGE
jgi:hypothetical protein